MALVDTSKMARSTTRRLGVAWVATIVVVGGGVAWLVPELVGSDGRLRVAQLLTIVVGIGVAGVWTMVVVIRSARRFDAEILSLRRATEQFIEAQRVSGVGHWDYDIENDDLVWSDEVYRIVGVDPDEFEHSHDGFFAFVHPDDRDRLNYERSRALAGVEPLDAVHRIIRPSGEIRWVHERGALADAPGGTPGHIMGTVHDITELRRANARVDETTSRLRRVLVRLQNAREEERTDLSNMVHDDVAARLTSVLLLYESLMSSLDRETREANKELTRSIEDELRATLETARDLARVTRPDFEREENLAEGLEALAGKWRRRSDVDIDVVVDGDPSALDTDRNAQLLRIAQEALTNVARHAEASSAQVVLRQTPHGLRLEISDDGRGMPPDARPSASLGLVIMEERALALGGRLDIESEPGEGCRVVCDIPHRVPETVSPETEPA